MLCTFVKSVTKDDSALSSTLQSYITPHISPLDAELLHDSTLQENERWEFLVNIFCDKVTRLYDHLYRSYNIKHLLAKLQADQGGKDAQDMTEMLYHAYISFFTKLQIQVNTLELSRSSAGLLNASFRIPLTPVTLGFLYENGLIRIERPSPFKQKKQIHTSHIRISFSPVPSTVIQKISPREIEITPIKSGGPGGQYVNKAYTGILLKHIPTGIIIRSTTYRSAQQNRKEALRILEHKLIKIQLEKSKYNLPPFIRSLLNTHPILRTLDFTMNLVRNQYPLRFKLKNLERILKGALDPIVMYNMIYVTGQKFD